MTRHEFAVRLAERLRRTSASPEVVDAGVYHEVTWQVPGARVCLTLWGEGDDVGEVLAFRGSQHLNRWRRGSTSPEDADELLDEAWASLWRDEVENQAAGRSLWMHGPELPRLEPAPSEDIFDIFA